MLIRERDIEDVFDLLYNNAKEVTQGNTKHIYFQLELRQSHPDSNTKDHWSTLLRGVLSKTTEQLLDDRPDFFLLINSVNMTSACSRFFETFDKVMKGFHQLSQFLPAYWVKNPQTQSCRSLTVAFQFKIERNPPFVRQEFSAYLIPHQRNQLSDQFRCLDKLVVREIATIG